MSFLLFPSCVLFLLVCFHKLFCSVLSRWKVEWVTSWVCVHPLSQRNLQRRSLAWEPSPRSWHLKWHAVLSMESLLRFISTIPPFLLWNKTLSDLQIYAARSPSMFWGYKQSKDKTQACEGTEHLFPCFSLPRRLCRAEWMPSTCLIRHSTPCSASLFFPVDWWNTQAFGKSGGTSRLCYSYLIFGL